MTKSSRIHAWLTENGPATVATIAEALGVNHAYVRNALYPYPAQFMVVATIESRGHPIRIWHARPKNTKRRRYQPVTLPDGRTVAAYRSAVNHCWLLADGVTVVWPVARVDEAQ